MERSSELELARNVELTLCIVNLVLDAALDLALTWLPGRAHYRGGGAMRQLKPLVDESWPANVERRALVLSALLAKKYKVLE